MNLTFGTVGSYDVKLIVSDGVCLDSTETQILIGGPSGSTFSVATCNSSYTWLDGVTYTSSNTTATHTLTNFYGCDSILTLNLAMNSSSSSTDQIIACESFTWINGNTYTSSNNTAQWTIPTAQGCDSLITLDLTILQSSSGTDVVTVCDSFLWIDGNTYTSDNSTATYILPNTQGCEAVVTLNLTVNSLTVTVVENDPELFGPAFVDSYQWVDCGNGYAPIIGDTSYLFTATVNGSYAVIVEQNGCTDTSACFMINSADILDIEKRSWSLSPNPTESFVNVQFDQQTDAKIEVLNDLGQLIVEYSIENVGETQIELGLDPGVYFVKVRTQNTESSLPVIKM